MGRTRVLVAFGTRPEAIKLCALVRRLQSFPQKFDVRVCVTGQHRCMLDQVLEVFQLRPDWDLNLMRPGQGLSVSTAAVLTALEPLLAKEKPDIVLVQGDTTTTFAAALASYHARVPVGHVEAGLRSGDRYGPFPEEVNRQLTTRLSDLHFAATKQAAANLRWEGIPAERIHVTGNTVVDAMLYVKKALDEGRLPRGEWPFLDPRRKLVIVTSHRRESFGGCFEGICHALIRLAAREDVQIVFPVHRNPNIDGPARRILGRQPRIHLLEPLSYAPFVDLMMRSRLILTDSGGIQEEAPCLGKPVLVMRERTERPEALEAGTARLVGTDPQRIVGEANRLLDNRAEYARIARRCNPYGDGRACERITEVLEEFTLVSGMREKRLQNKKRPMAVAGSLAVRDRAG